ncbi:MAG: ATP-binding protein [Oscillospiraceae bacterium]|nr:ATP-binding protein [Oscillospiraceae bacterium]MDD4367972.1 ATP-binding protein [Oscillospiraceae bacterium]
MKQIESNSQAKTPWSEQRYEAGTSSYARIYTAVHEGVRGQLVRIEISLSPGLPYFDIAGMKANAAAAVRSRIRAAIRNSGFDFPKRRITASFSPEVRRQNCRELDLPLTLCLLQADGQLALPMHCAALGEVALSGDILPDRDFYNLLSCLSEYAARSELSLIFTAAFAEALQPRFKACVFPVSSLADAAKFLRAGLSSAQLKQEAGRRLNLIKITPPPALPPRPAVSYIEGQSQALAALVIAAAGRHHLIIKGGPGCGKSFLISLLPYLLPELTEPQLHLLRCIYAAGSQPVPELVGAGYPPLRQPHYRISAAALLGGGVPVLPGEITLAQHGILFLDELNEFKPGILDLLRLPLSEGVIRLARANQKIVFPADFLLVGASNPCPCGQLYEPGSTCGCSDREIARFNAKLSAPIRDRVDLEVILHRIPAGQLSQTVQHQATVDLAVLQQQVKQARHLQQMRYQAYDHPEWLNSNVPADVIKQVFEVTASAMKLAQQFALSAQLSVRGFQKLLRVARTQADLRACPLVENADIALAAQFKITESGSPELP